MCLPLVSKALRLVPEPALIVRYFYDAYADTLDGNLDVRLARYGIRY